MADSTAIHLSIDSDGIAELSFDLSDSRVNLLTTAVWIELRNHLHRLRQSSSLRGLLISSAKPGAFIAGADLKWFRNRTEPGDPAVRELVTLGHGVLAELEALPVPTCALIDGAALGGGLELALACDARLAGTNPKVALGLPEVHLGLIPGWGGTQRLPRLIGLESSARLLREGISVSAAEALRIGLIDAQIESGSLRDAGKRWLLEHRRPQRESRLGPVRIAEGEAYRPAVPSAPPAEREAMLCLSRGAPLPLQDALTIEAEAFLRLVGSDDSRSRIESFFASRR